MHIRKILSTLAVLAATLQAPAQEPVVENKGYGINLSANFALGTHFNRVGLNLHFYYLRGQFQANSEARAYFNFRNLGPGKMYPEFVLSQGFLFSYGPDDAIYNPFFNSVSNQGAYRNSIAYSYNLYLNRIGTSQQTGIVAFQFKELSFIAENDILARPILDRFRTGAVMVQYQYEDRIQAAVNCVLWTGQFGGKKEIFNIPDFHNNCYMDTTGGRFTGYSHGLLSIQAKYNLGHAQNVQLNAGIDAEQVRNEVQNKFFHNMKFVPQEINKAKNCHLPMIDSEGNLFLFEDGKKVRAPRAYVNFFTNAGLFY